jgi:hypothetical protein
VRSKNTKIRVIIEIRREVVREKRNREREKKERETNLLIDL